MRKSMLSPGDLNRLADALGQISRRLMTAPDYCFGNFASRLISRICRMCRCSCVEVSSAH